MPSTAEPGCVGLGRGVHRLNEALFQSRTNAAARRSASSLVARTDSWMGCPTADRCGPSVEERGDCSRCVDLDHPVKVTDIDPKLQRACRHDHAILPLGKRLFRQAAFLNPEGTVGDEGLHLLLPQVQGKLFHPGSAVAEDQPLLAFVQKSDDLGGVGE